MHEQRPQKAKGTINFKPDIVASKSGPIKDSTRGTFSGEASGPFENRSPHG